MATTKSQPASPAKVAWRISEWRAALSLGHTTACEMVAKGEVPSVPVGKRVRLITESPQAWLARRAAAEAAKVPA